MTETRRRIITFGLLLANIMAGFEGTIISTAMPTIVADLHGLSLMNWDLPYTFYSMRLVRPFGDALPTLSAAKEVSFLELPSSSLVRCLKD